MTVYFDVTFWFESYLFSLSTRPFLSKYDSGRSVLMYIERAVPGPLLPDHSDDGENLESGSETLRVHHDFFLCRFVL